jgi:enoyl-CoA hydratase/carnithine racemase
LTLHAPVRNKLERILEGSVSLDFGGGDDIRFERRGLAGIVTLTRPKSLNAVTHPMVLALERALDAWLGDDGVRVVIIKAEGRAFSAGGDIVDIYRAGMAGKPPVRFFADEYRLNAKIAAYPKPYVALVNGIAMGGGVGVSYHGSHRVVTENAVFAMPEVGIGFFPDVGGSFLLSRLRGGFGLYLGLTGTRIRWGDQLWCGLATHAVRSEALAGLVEQIAETGEPDAALSAVCEKPPRETDEARRFAIDKHFSLGSLKDIVASLESAAADDPFASETLATLRSKSPTSLHVAFAQIVAGAALEMPECMKMEFRILNRMLAGPDFYEGIRAAVIDKDNAPVWRPARLEEVDAAATDAYFAPLGEEELQL